MGTAIGAGSDVAVETADVILVRGTPLDVVVGVQLGRATYRNARVWRLKTGTSGPLIVALVAIVGLLLLFGGAAMTGGRMGGGMMGTPSMGGSGWMWIPAVLTLCLGALLVWVIVAKRP